MAFLNQWLMRVTRYDYMNARSVWLDINMGEIMDGIDEQRAYLQKLGLFKVLYPLTTITVAADGGKRRQISEFFQDGRVADIPRVDDEIAASQELPGLGPQKPVSVGNEAYAEHD